MRKLLISLAVLVLSLFLVPAAFAAATVNKDKDLNASATGSVGDIFAQFILDVDLPPGPVDPPTLSVFASGFFQDSFTTQTLADSEFSFNKSAQGNAHVATTVADGLLAGTPIDIAWTGVGDAARVQQMQKTILNGTPSNDGTFAFSSKSVSRVAEVTGSVSGGTLNSLGSISKGSTQQITVPHP